MVRLLFLYVQKSAQKGKVGFGANSTVFAPRLPVNVTSMEVEELQSQQKYRDKLLAGALGCSYATLLDFHYWFLVSTYCVFAACMMVSWVNNCMDVCWYSTIH